MKKQLLIWFMVVICICAVTMGTVSLIFTSNEYRGNTKAELLTFCTMFNDAYEQGEEEQLVDSFAKSTGARVTLLDKDGRVRKDSQVEIEENHGGRPEITQAFEQGSGIAERYSKTTLTRYVYAAQKLDNGEVVRFALPLSNLHAILLNHVKLILLAAFFALLLALLFAVRFSNSLSRQIRLIGQFAKKRLEGGTIQMIECNRSAPPEIRELAGSIEEMTRKIEVNLRKKNERAAQLNTILESIDCGVLAVDNDNTVILINRYAMEELEVTGQQVLGKNVFLSVRSSALNEFLEAGRKQECITVGERIFQLLANPILNGETRMGTAIIIQDITDSKRFEQYRSEFVSNVAHELKTPLTSIGGFVETLKSGAIEDRAAAQRFLDIIQQETERLNSLIRDILSISHLESLKEDEALIFDAGEPVRDVFELVRQKAEEKQITLALNQEKGVRVFADPFKIKQLLLNLITNAIVYNEPGGSVTVGLTESGGSVVYKVSDTGIGIPNEHLERIFERFYRVDRGRSRNLGGTGLGLSIVKHIVQFYQGDISVTSELGKGTEFTVRLPICQ